MLQGIAAEYSPVSPVTDRMRALRSLRIFGAPGPDNWRPVYPALGKVKHMPACKLHLHKGQAFFKIRLRFTRKAHNEIGGNGHFRPNPPGQSDNFCKGLRRRFAGHVTQGAFTTRLQRQVQMPAQAGFSPQVEKISPANSTAPAMITSTAADPFPAKSFDEILQMNRVCKILAPRPRMHPGQHHFFRSASQGGMDIGQMFLPLAVARPPRQAGDAKCAVIITAVLHLDKGPRPLVNARQRLPCQRFQVKSFRRNL